MQDWAKLIFSPDISFEEKVQQVFEYQVEYNSVYRRYCKALNGKALKQVQGDIAAIPLLPIKAFKDVEVISREDNSTKDIQSVAIIFKSSGTSEMQRSVHRVMDPRIYEESLLRGFNLFYNLESAVIWGYTPGYAENPDSSLIYMIQKLIEQDDSGLSCFLPLDKQLEKKAVDEVKKSGKQLIIFGAAFGLLDVLEKKKVGLPSNSIVIETGGMKTNRREISRKELHRRLAKGFGLDSSRIHSEYGMAELLSQAYATGSEWFRTVPWMNVSIRNPENPFEKMPAYHEGLIGIIDLANVHSCSFLLTGDRGMMDQQGRFKVMGRWNPKDLRGCNFLMEED